MMDLHSRYERFFCEAIDWDSVPPSVQNRIARLERALEDWEENDVQPKKVRAQQIAIIKKKIKDAEKPYVKKKK